MSWQAARKEAQRWLDQLQLQTSKLKGQKIDLSEQAKSLRGEPKFIAMIIRAAKRILFKRGIVAEIQEPTPLGRTLGDEDVQDETADR